MTEHSTERSSNRMINRTLEMLEKAGSKKNTFANKYPWSSGNFKRNNAPIPEHTDSRDYSTSPTPKRRKMATPQSADKTTVQANSNSLDNLKISLVFPKDSERPLSSSSPCQKSVSFSDRIEVESSSAQTNSAASPRPSSTSKLRSKPILKLNRVSLQKGDIVTEQRLTFSARTTFSLNPMELAYWRSGEIHNMTDIKNINELKNIFEGGLSLLAVSEPEHVSKRFEIYATFNAILERQFGDNTPTGMEDKVCSVLCAHMEEIVNVCYPHLKLEQSSLLENVSVKNPFSTRLYIQIVRFFTHLLSNFKVICALSSKRNIQTSMKQVFESSYEALSSPHCNKQMITAQMIFLRQEKFGTSYLTENERNKLVNIITEVNEIDSYNLKYEKLLLIKALFGKYLKQMLQDVPKWLCGEVLARILVETQTYANKLAVVALEILLDLLKQLLGGKDSVTASIYESMEEKPAKDVLSPSMKMMLQSVLPDTYDFETITIGSMLRDHLRNQITEQKAYKIGIDLWLALVGILFNSPRNITKLLPTDDRGDSWLSLNELAFKTNDEKAMLLALKSWRVVIYLVSVNITSLESDEVQLQLLQLLLTPFDQLPNVLEKDCVREGLLYCLNGVVFCSVSMINSLGTQNAISLFWDNLLQPLFHKWNSAASSNELQTRTMDIFIKILRGKFPKTSTQRSNSPNTKQQQHNFRPVRVIAARGIVISDIPNLSNNFIHIWYMQMAKSASDLLRTRSFEDEHAKSLFLSLIDTVPESSLNDEVFDYFLLVLKHYLEPTYDYTFNQLSVLTLFATQLVTKFEKLLLEPSNSGLSSVIALYDSKTFINYDFPLKLMISMLDSNDCDASLFAIFSKFMDMKNKNYPDYVTNWLSVAVLPSNMNRHDMKFLMNIISKNPLVSIIENLLTVIADIDREFYGMICTSALTWDDHALLYFIKGVFTSNAPNSCNYLSGCLPTRISKSLFLFKAILNSPELFKENGIVLRSVLKNPSLIQNLNVAEVTKLRDLSDHDAPTDFMKYINVVYKKQIAGTMNNKLSQSGTSTDKSNSECFNEPQLDNQGQTGEDTSVVVLEKLHECCSNNKGDALTEILSNLLSQDQTTIISNFFCSYAAQNIEVIKLISPKLLRHLCKFYPDHLHALILPAINYLFGPVQKISTLTSLAIILIEKKDINGLDRIIDPFSIFLFKGPKKLSSDIKHKIAGLFLKMFFLLKEERGVHLSIVLHRIVRSLPRRRPEYLKNVINTISTQKNLENKIPDINDIQLALTKWIKLEDYSSYLLKYRRYAYLDQITNQVGITQTNRQPHSNGIVGTNIAQIEVPEMQSLSKTKDNAAIEEGSAQQGVETLITGTNSIGMQENFSQEPLNDSIDRTVHSHEGNGTQATYLANALSRIDNEQNHSTKQHNASTSNSLTSTLSEVTSYGGLIQSDTQEVRTTLNKESSIDDDIVDLSQKSSPVEAVGTTCVHLPNNIHEIDIDKEENTTPKKEAQMTINTQAVNESNSATNLEVRLSALPIETGTQMIDNSNKYKGSEMVTGSDLRAEGKVSKTDRSGSIITRNSNVNHRPGPENSSGLLTLAIYKSTASREAPNTQFAPEVHFGPKKVEPVTSVKMIKRDQGSMGDIVQEEKDVNTAFEPFQQDAAIAKVALKDDEMSCEIQVSENENCADDTSSKEGTPSLHIHFPSKKARKIVNRLRDFKPDQLAALSAAERRNLRVELLDFMMKMEYFEAEE
ncbi:DNA-binding protein RIF1 KNAG_0C01830 [Huiozyma naganishii CBS 8797]|uniref:Telomere-associated protein Rif1 N-terminal domain-containing protein n=1 Tax=Huiozyma naganishii (strain ATCC MYA-139 / BCRC 22969 / CBS 8797 / KCTC 17520 / NBRC 10181 / NCYC 3082 / Yp74L-3) TaxID=1071383 RepID=J7RWC2_HUIN7|nr:hypothetical protein KNAG_0C01830 [Kazachstania naganishii CBS 8797]CCK69297.1 hypothetical protein KNAG_0C01830 [Kazachstania naganishii CBS 8797]